MKLTKNDLLYAGLSKDEFKKIENDVSEENRNSLKMYTALVAVFFALMFVCSLFFSIAKAGRWFYFSFLCAALALCAVSRYAKMSKTAVIVSIYFFWLLMFAAGILLAFAVSPDKNAVTFIALLLVAPLLFIDKPIRVIVFMYFYVLIFIVGALFFKDPAVRVMDIIHVLLYSTVGVIIGYFVIRTKFQRYYYDYKARVVGVTDLLTGVNNRNAFELNRSVYADLCKNGVGFCYVDANGLHERNNEFGHDSGDELLKNIANELISLFGGKNVYRIGGDEFVAIIPDAEKSEMERLLGELETFSARHGNILSFGYAEQDRGEIDTEVLIRAAETEMYRAKKRHYAEQNGKYERFRDA